MHFWILSSDIAPSVILAVVLAVFLSRKLRRKLPFFFALMLFQLGYFVAGALAYAYALSDPQHLTHFYQWVIVTGLAVGSIFELGVLYELSGQLLLSCPRFWANLRNFLRWATVTLLLLAAVISALMASGTLARVMAVFQALDFSSNLIKIGLLLTLVLFTRVLGISWRSLPAGIALGFGISALAEMIASALISQFGPTPLVTVDFIRMMAYHVCVLVWLVYILLPDKRNPTKAAGLQMSELEDHVHELQRMVRR